MDEKSVSATPEQEAIIDIAGQRQGSVMVEAGAGCAKTTTLQMASKRIKVPALTLTFAKANTLAMEKAMPSHFTCKSFNSLGHSAWFRGEAQGATPALDNRKVGKLISMFAKDRKMELDEAQWDAARRLVSKAQMSGLVPSSAEGGAEGATLVEDTKENWEFLADEIDIIREDFEMVQELARDVLIADIALARQGTITYDDQIYCSTLLGGKFPQYPVVFVDEDQDLAMLQVKMLAAASRSDGRLFAVGDKHQGIYAFRGASGNAASLIKGLRSEWTELPLMTSFRVPKAVAARQVHHVPGFRAWHTNPYGDIQVLQPDLEQELDYEGWSFQDLARAKPAENSKIAVLCRNNAPLLSLAFKLLRRSIGCSMLGREIGKGLIALSRKIVPADETPRDVCVGRITDWITSEVALAKANGKPDREAGISDKGMCLLAVMEGAEARSAGQLRSLLIALFSRTDGLVTLSSVHKAKGLEWDVVVHLDPWRVPSKQAKEAAKRGAYGALVQEMNLKYVCETRTKHTLVLADLRDFH